MSTNVYYAHPIDQAETQHIRVRNEDQSAIVRKEVSSTSRVLDVIGQALRQLEDAVVFDPAKAWQILNCEPNSSVQLANMRLIETSIDVVLVAAPAGVPTIGTWLEVNKAIHFSKQVVIVTDISGSWALEYLATLQNVSVVYLDNPTETTHVDEIRRLINAS